MMLNVRSPMMSSASVSGRTASSYRSILVRLLKITLNPIPRSEAMRWNGQSWFDTVPNILSDYPDTNS